jgi:hypothetical protein
VSALCQYHAAFVTVALKYNLKSDIVIPPALFFLLRSTFAIQGLLCSHMIFRIYFSVSVKNDIGILMGLALNL